MRTMVTARVERSVFAPSEEGHDLIDLLAPPAWAHDALGPEHPEVEFFPEQGVPIAPARAICARCSVQRECLAFALEEGIDDGVWGGSSRRERRKLRAHGVTGEMVARFGPRIDEGRKVMLDESFDDLRAMLASV